MIGEGVDVICEELKGWVIFFFGYLGVGKLIFINVFVLGLEVKIVEILVYYNKGMYIIIFFEMFFVLGDGYIIDILGIKGFGIFDMEEEEIGYYFFEIFKILVNCKYGNCIYC